MYVIRTCNGSITAQLTESICNQIQDASSISQIAVQLAQAEVRKSKEENLKSNFDNICKILPTETERYLRTAAEKGASSWLVV